MPMENTEFKHRPALRRACALLGSRAALARAIDVKPQQIDNWLRRDKEIDPVYCARIEAATDKQVTRQQLRQGDWSVVWPELASFQGTAHA
ncbi:phage protein [Bordetella bronchiseptica]|nr:phage protein [Bordetella bronchiseptica]